MSANLFFLKSGRSTSRKSSKQHGSYCAANYLSTAQKCVQILGLSVTSDDNGMVKMSNTATLVNGKAVTLVNLGTILSNWFFFADWSVIELLSSPTS